MLTIIGTDILIRSFFTKSQGNTPVSAFQQWLLKLLGIQKKIDYWVKDLNLN